MRRALAAAVLGLSLWIGSLAWSAFIVTNTVLDPGRSQDVAEALYEDEAVRAQLVQNMAGALEAGLPDGAPVDRATLDAAAERALETPAVEAVVTDAFVGTHRAFLGEGEAPGSLDAGAFGSAARASLVESRPELDAVLPASPSLRVPLPTRHLPDFGPVRDVLRAAIPVLAGAAAVGGVVALVVTSNRPAVIRRAGFWAIGLSAVVLVFALGLPAVATRLAPDQAQIVAALIGAMAASTLAPALGLAGAGLGALVVAMVWRSAPRPAPPAAATPAPTSSRRPPLQGRPRPPRGRRPSVVPPTVAPAPAVPEPLTYSPPPKPRPGRVLDPHIDQIPANARWVAGVGYVIDPD